MNDAAATRRAGALLLGMLVVLTALRAWFAAVVELSPDEAYYWVWSQNLAAGYFDHPPAVAWLIRAGCALFGERELGVRFGALLAGVLVPWLVFVSARRLALTPRVALATALLAASAPLLAVGSVIHTPDACLAIAWSLGVWAALRTLQRGRTPDWLLLGAAAGLAMLSKASGLGLLLGLGLFGVGCSRGRGMLRGSGPVLAVGVALLLVLPNWLWNHDHAGGSWSFQWAHGLGEPAFRPLGLPEFLLGQFGVIGPLLCLALAGFAVVGWRRDVRNGNPEVFLLWCLSGPLLLGFSILSLTRHVEANWPAPAYLAALPGAAWALGGGVWYLRRSALWTSLALGIGLSLSALVHLQALWPVLPLPEGADPTARVRGWRALADQAVADATALNASLAAEGYGPTSELRFYGARPVFYQPCSTRASQFDLTPEPVPGPRVLFLQPATSQHEPHLCEQMAERWLLLRRSREGAQRLGDFRWWVCEGPEGARGTEPATAAEVVDGR